jgi:hypothetical protein
MKLADRWDSIERDRKLLDEQRKELEMQKNAIFIEKVCWLLFHQVY